MISNESFSREIEARLKLHEIEKTKTHRHMDEEMKHFLMQQDVFKEAARRILTTTVYPRMQVLSHHFENAELKGPEEAKSRMCICEFAHTKRFPVTATLAFAVFPGERYESLEIRSNVEILPSLMKFEHHDQRTFGVSDLDEDQIGKWVETKLLSFLETYLKIETHPQYQRDNFVICPVCEMRIPFFEVAATVERKHETVYFCSHACKDRFLKENP
jgi:YHS domain-containing protein